MSMAFVNLTRGIKKQKKLMGQQLDAEQQALSEAKGEYEKGWAPYKDFGGKAIRTLQDLIDNPSLIRELPGYQFGMSEGSRAVENSAAARGMQLSGRTLQELQDRAQGYQDQFYGNEYNRRMGAADWGRTGDMAYTQTLADLAIGKGQSLANYFKRMSDYVNFHERQGMEVFKDQLGTWTGALSAKTGGGMGGGGKSGGSGGNYGSFGTDGGYSDQWANRARSSYGNYPTGGYGY